MPVPSRPGLTRWGRHFQVAQRPSSDTRGLDFVVRYPRVQILALSLGKVVLPPRVLTVPAPGRKTGATGGPPPSGPTAEPDSVLTAPGSACALSEGAAHRVSSCSRPRLRALFSHGLWPWLEARDSAGPTQRVIRAPGNELSSLGGPHGVPVCALQGAGTESVTRFLKFPLNLYLIRFI